MPWLTRDFCRELLAFSSADWHSHIAYIASSQPQGYSSKKVSVGLCSENNLFHVADTHFYMLLSWSVGPLVHGVIGHWKIWNWEILLYCSFVEQLLCPCPTIRYPVSVSLCWACLLCHLNISLLYNRVLCGITEQRMMDYACTLQFSLLHGPKRLQFLSKYANKFINITIGTMQLGFCMAYLVFIGEYNSWAHANHVKRVLFVSKEFGLEVDDSNNFALPCLVNPSDGWSVCSFDH